MNRADIYGGITVDLNDGPIATTYGRDVNGKPTAQLVIGDGARSLGISVTRSSIDTVTELETAVAELKAWVQRQAMKEVA